MHVSHWIIFTERGKTLDFYYAEVSCGVNIHCEDHSPSMPMYHGETLFTSEFCLGCGGGGIIHLMNSDKSREDISRYENDTSHFVPVQF